MSAASSSSSSSGESCPLCAGAPRAFLSADGRDYLRCGTCALTFMPAAQHADPARERARYAEHKNTPSDPGYRGFLDRLLTPSVGERDSAQQILTFEPVNHPAHRAAVVVHGSAQFARGFRVPFEQILKDDELSGSHLERG